MTEKLINLPQAAELLGTSYAVLAGYYRKHTFGLPKAVDVKGRGGANLYRYADFVEYDKTSGRRKGLDNELAQLFLAYKIGSAPAGECHVN
jgi:molybdate-binding protein